jgi:hypothetical protein
VKKTLANSEPSTHGTKRTFRDVCYSSASGGKADISQRWRTIVDFMSTRPSFDLGENFIDARKHAPDNLDHLAPQDVEFAAQPLDVALAPFTAHRTSSRNCSNSARNSNGGPQEPSDSTGVAV